MNTTRHAPLLEVEGLSKTFDGNRVVEDVALTVGAGEVHALVGHNGSGKSTVIKVLSGFHTADPGLVVSRPPLAFVHQDLALVPTSTVLENLALGQGFQTRRSGAIAFKRERVRAAALLAEFDVHVHPDELLERLSPVERSLVAIARALRALREQGQGVLLLDEPTASLTEREVERVLGEIRRVADEGSGVVFVSHHLDEVLSAADVVHVMRNGRLVASEPAAALDEDRLIALMLGRLVQHQSKASARVLGGVPVIEVDRLRGRRLRDISFELRRGEIFGVTGLAGSGKTELGRLLFGAERRAGGEVIVGGVPQELPTPAAAMRAGIAYVPPERRTQGGIAELTASENVVLPTLQRFWRGGWWRRGAARTETATWLRRTAVTPPDPDRPFHTFSGGNQQKIVLAKWLRTRPRLLILDEPDQGVDIGACQELYDLVVAAAVDGVCVLLLSSEWVDMERLCDRVLVLDRGRSVCELTGSELTRDNLAGAALAGGHR